MEGIGTAEPIMSNTDHVPEGQFVSYSTTPPTSGPHWSQPANCGLYDEPVPDARIVHNLEHGNVVISYNLPDEEEAERFRQIAEDLPGLGIWGVVRPYTSIESGDLPPIGVPQIMRH